MGTVTDAAHQTSRLSTGWGFAVIILGMLAIMMPFVTGVAVSSMVAIIVAAAGMTMTVYAFKAGSLGRGIFQFLFGGITLLCGVGMFLTPVLSMWTITAFLMAYFLVDGAFTIAAGMKAKPADGWGWIVFSGISSVLLAILLYAKWPASGAFAVGLLVGIRLVFAGWSIAMLGMASDAMTDAVEESVEEAKA